MMPGVTTIHGFLSKQTLVCYACRHSGGTPLCAARDARVHRSLSPGKHTRWGRITIVSNNSGNFALTPIVCYTDNCERILALTPYHATVATVAGAAHLYR